MRRSIPHKIVLFFALFFVSCSSLPYQDDVGFLVSAQANSPEAPLFLNGQPCRDLDGNPGLCSKRIKSTDSILLHLDPMSYSYDITISCTSPILVPGATVPANQPLDIKIAPAQMQGLLSFVCIGEIFPQDRAQPLSSKWEIRIVVVDAAYVGREQIQVIQQNGKTYLVLGKYARSSWVFDGAKWSSHGKDTVVEIKDPTKVQAWSESFSSRFNYFQWSAPVSTRSSD